MSVKTTEVSLRPNTSDIHRESDSQLAKSVPVIAVSCRSTRLGSAFGLLLTMTIIRHVDEYGRSSYNPEALLDPLLWSDANVSVFQMASRIKCP